METYPEFMGNSLAVQSLALCTYQGSRFNPWRETKIPQTAWHGQTNKNKNYKNFLYKLQSTYYSTTFFFELQSIIKNHTSPIYITHIRTHSCLPSPITHGIEQADKLVSFATPKNNMLWCTTMLAVYTSYEKSHTTRLKKFINNCSTCRPLHL